ncbi:uncharacterized protein BDW43DRAFT_293187 [Aspergillus alliaceus]|uniref:uncharacterized protein n=1 Tax=Petromyces alliaceus TaxID=209559 RepID=UPI0012A4EB1F|nr:uncharacterized protein BDW43DRAFT_293187 [Aspergillus alliaceus]KAB8227825.1 hypothetical protein BDW43DRAFT_293187 [Aspergillus alliaceus]
MVFCQVSKVIDTYNTWFIEHLPSSCILQRCLIIFASLLCVFSPFLSLVSQKKIEN